MVFDPLKNFTKHFFWKTLFQVYQVPINNTKNFRVPIFCKYQTSWTIKRYLIKTHDIYIWNVGIIDMF